MEHTAETALPLQQQQQDESFLHASNDLDDVDEHPQHPPAGSEVDSSSVNELPSNQHVGLEGDGIDAVTEGDASQGCERESGEDEGRSDLFTADEPAADDVHNDNDLDLAPTEHLEAEDSVMRLPSPIPLVADSDGDGRVAVLQAEAREDGGEACDLSFLTAVLSADADAAVAVTADACSAMPPSSEAANEPPASQPVRLLLRLQLQ
jgi:hypothetical protein